MACSPAERLGHAPGLQGQVEDGLAGRGGVKGVVEDPEQPLVLGEVAEEGPPGDLGRLGDLVDGRPVEPALLEQLRGPGRGRNATKRLDYPTEVAGDRADLSPAGWRRP
jgi:hypothetical protein